MPSYLKKRGQLKVAFVYRDDDYGKTGLAHFKAAGESAGFQVIDAEPIAATASDATTQLTHVKAANPQAVVVWTTLPSANVVIKGYRELSLPYPLYYSDGVATGLFLQESGSELGGAFIATTKINVADQLPASDPQKKLLARYIDAFTRAYPNTRGEVARRARTRHLHGGLGDLPDVTGRPQRSLCRLDRTHPGRESKVQDRASMIGAQSVTQAHR
jgi:branched-chain amino acid transport system substrate-binding protein